MSVAWMDELNKWMNRFMYLCVGVWVYINDCVCMCGMIDEWVCVYEVYMYLSVDG